MIPAKKYIKSLERLKNPVARAGFLRLDKNEAISAFDQEFVDKLRQEITGDFLTSYPEADILYRDLARWLNCRPENIYLTAGSDAAIKAVFEVFVEPGDTVAFVSPTYAMVYVYTQMFQANPIEIHYDKDLSLPVDEILKVLKEKHLKLIYIANPNSPTATIIEPDALKNIIDVAEKQNTIALLDEAYYLFYPHTQIDCIYDHPNLVITRTFSKAFGLAAARLGFAVAHADTISILAKVRPMYEANYFALRFADIILNSPGLVEKNVKMVLDGKKYLEDELGKLGIGYHKSYANFMLIDVGSYDKSVQIGKALYQKLILMKSGFKEDVLKNYIRVSIGNTDQMKIFLENFKEAYYSAEHKT